jgi:hypothetical protein
MLQFSDIVFHNLALDHINRGEVLVDDTVVFESRPI